MSDFLKNFFTKPEPVITLISKNEYLDALYTVLQYQCENEIETWRSVPDLNYKYEVSNLGNVKSIIFREPLILTPIQKGNNLYVNVVQRGKRKQIRLDWLVAKVYLANPNGYNKVIHKDGDQQNCMFTNLSWR